MSSIYSRSNNSPIASEVLPGSFTEQGWLPDSIRKSASAQREIEVQLVMDRLLREYLTRKVDRGACGAP